MTRSSPEWVAGDPTWSEVYAAVRWAAQLYTVVLTGVLVLNFLWLFGTITSPPAGSFSWSEPFRDIGLGLWLVPFLVLVFATVILPTRKAVYRIAPTDHGLAVRGLLWNRVIPWASIRWTSATRFEWLQVGGSARATVTPEQSQRIYRWFHPS